MNSPELINRTVAQGRALVWAIEALDTIEPRDPFERAVAELFQAAYRRRLMEIVEATPSWVADAILNAAEHLEIEKEIEDEDRQAVLQVDEQELSAAATAA